MLKLLQGLANEPLNDNGVKLAGITWRGMKDVNFICCISSALIRARQTVEIILKENGSTDTPITFESYQGK